MLNSNNTAWPDFDGSPAIHLFFERHASQNPHALAVAYEDQQLTYGQLNVKANQLARCLTTAGVGPDVPVGICIERGPDLLIAILGILKAGGAYIPLDPSYPRERLAMMIEDARPPVLVVSHALIPMLPQTSATIFDLEGATKERARQDDSNLELRTVPTNLAYMIFTSGSTGRPKGVMVSHAALVNYFNAMAHEYELTPDLRHFDMTSFSFDVFTGNWTRALSSGACLTLCPRERLLDGEWLYHYMRDRKVGYADFVPAVFRPLMQYLMRSGNDLKFMRYVVLGSEAWSAAEYDQGLALMAEGARFLNTYGVTETTIETTFFDRKQPIVASMGLQPQSSVPIGRAFARQPVYVLDDRLNQLGPNQEGFLMIGGDGLARGYFGRPAMTAERFIPDPHSDQPGSRLYCSGDRAKLGEDGSLHYINRADHQIKIRGFRVELGDIEAAIASHPDVHQAAVLYREDHGLKHLVGYIVPQPGQSPQPHLIRERLKQDLPDYMVPASYVIMDQFPLTPNGKLDRKGLPAPKSGRPELDSAMVYPRTPEEETIAAIWREFLGINEIGVYDNLMEMGGHSLLATQIVVQVRDAFKTDLKLSHFLRNPTIAAMAQAVTENAGAKRLPPMVRVSREGHNPLAYPQELVWFLTQMYPESVAYNFQMIVRFRGQLDIPALERTLTEIVRRHEILHSNFVKLDGIPSIKVGRPFTITLPPIDITGLPESEREAQARLIGDMMFREQFDIVNDELIRWKLVRLAEDHYMLLHQEHHMVHDGWTVKVFLGEINALYRAYLDGRPSPLPELPFQVVDYAAWQHNYMTGDVLAEKVKYWREKLDGCCPNTYLPLDFPRPSGQTFEGNEIVDPMPAELFRKLKEYGRRRGYSLFNTVLSAFEILLWRYTGQEDQVIGSAVANRQTPESELLIGMLVNTIVIRVQLRPEMPFLQFMEVVRNACLDTFEHQDLPFELLIRNLDLPDRDVSRNPLSQVMFGFHDSPVPDMDLPGVNAELIYLDNKTAKMDLNLTVIPRSQQGFAHGAEVTDSSNTFHWEWNTALFKESTVRRLIKHYHAILWGILENDMLSLDEISLFTKEESAEVLESISRMSQRNANPSATLHGLFEQSAARHAAKPAVHCEGRVLTYEALDQAANRLAGRLAALGVSGRRVGVCLPRSEQCIVAMLAVLKAGGTYLPMEPNLPEDRKRHMASGAAAILTQERVRDQIPELGLPLIMVDEQTSDPGAKLPSVASTDLAYIIFTSGSTGVPKGVCVSHGAAVDHLVAAAEFYEMRADDTVLEFASFSFDVSMEQVFVALASGAALVVRGDGIWTPQQLADHIVANGITVMNLTPLYLNQWLRESYCMERLAKLRLAISGGEALSPDLVRLWRERGAPFRLINGYGPTEAIITPCAYDVPRNAPAAESASIPIGRPLAGRLALVMDQRGHLLPDGVPGELCLGWPLAEGYLDDPEKTQAAFVERPQVVSGQKLYRTGDRVRRLDSGDLEYLGRLDSQVKLRGFRIELGEIETRIAEYPQVKEAAVAVWGEGEMRYLAGYVTGKDLDIKALEAYLESHLPAHMVPSPLVLLEQMPVTSSGKIDRNRLPEPSRASLGGKVAPRNVIEEILAGIWADALGLKDIGIFDNFFQMGGHSLLATRALSRINEAFEIQLTLKYFFTTPTIAAMAAVINDELTGRHEHFGTIPKLDREAPMPLSSSQRRLWFLDQMDPGANTYNMGASLRLQGPLDRAALAAAVDVVIGRQESLRIRFKLVGEEPMQFAVEGVTNALGFSDLSNLPSAEREAAAYERHTVLASTAFDLATGPLYRFELVRLAEEDHVLMVVMHHIISDGWSVGILHQELGAAYEAALNGTEAKLPDLPIQFADFAAWQQAHITGERLSQQLLWWRNCLSGKLPVLELPTDHAPGKIHSRSGRDYNSRFPVELAQGFRKLATENGATLFMGFLAAFKIFLYRHTGVEDVIVGTPISNRNRREVEHLVGFFVNTLPLRTALDGRSSYETILQRVRSQTLGAYANQDVPFERLVEEIHPERDLHHPPIFQVLFMMESRKGNPQNFPGVQQSRYDYQTSTSKFDWSLMLQEHDEGLDLWVEYNNSLYEASTVARFSENLGQLLAAIVSQPKRPIDDLVIMSAQQRQCLIESWNQTDATFGSGPYLHYAFERHAAQHGADIAVATAEQSLSYAQLADISSRLATRLRAMGVGQEVPVMLSVPRNVQLPVCILAILKAGAIYVPVDANHPVERLKYVLQDSGAKLVISTTAGLDKLGDGQVASLAVDREWDAIQKLEPITGQEIDSRSAAYIIYTSGSAGLPKGTLVSHQSATHLIDWSVETIGRKHLARSLFGFSISFDPHVYELFMPLSGGGTAVLIDNLLQLNDDPAAANLTYMTGVPSIMSELVAAQHLPKSLEVILIGGEALSTELVGKINAACPRVRVIYDAYGPTETTIIATLAKRDDAPATIGKPISNYQAYVLDAHAQPQPIGVSGELCIGGVGLARGYVNRAGLTAERFIPNPFHGSPGARLYRTGDRARFRADGMLLFLGRLDRQVKIRGHRIEPGEIEKRIAAIAGVSSATVVPYGSSDQVQLIAYLVAADSVDDKVVSQYLAENLPAYMVPSRWIRLASLPLTRHGKVDYAALPAPEGMDQEAAYVAPANAVEEVVALIWSMVLKQDKVSCQADFFELGGHSLLVTRVQVRVKQVFKLDLTMRELFEATTPARQAACIIAKQAEPGLAEKVANVFLKLNRMTPEEKLAFLKK